MASVDFVTSSSSVGAAIQYAQSRQCRAVACSGGKAVAAAAARRRPPAPAEPELTQRLSLAVSDWSGNCASCMAFQPAF